MAVRSKVGLVKDGFMPGKPKKLVKGRAKIQSIPQPLVMENVKHIVDKVNRCNNKCYVMATLICNLPSVEVWVRKEYLTDQKWVGRIRKGRLGFRVNDSRTRFFILRHTYQSM